MVKKKLMGLGVCLNCGNPIKAGYDTCSQNCAEEYFRYVFEEELEDHPEFNSNIDPSGL